MSICPEGYMPRVVDAEVQECLAIYGAVEICGTKWCGKTWTSMRHGESIVHIDEGQNLAMAQADPRGCPRRCEASRHRRVAARSEDMGHRTARRGRRWRWTGALDPHRVVYAEEGRGEPQRCRQNRPREDAPDEPLRVG